MVELSSAQADAIVKEAKEALQRSWEWDRDNRREAALDLEFLAGNQWPDNVRRDREMSNRPVLTINRLPQFVRQVTNDIRQADLAIKVSPVDDRSDPELAKIYNGLLRQIHYSSSAAHVYAMAAEAQAACGIGWFRILTDYAGEDTFDQELRVKGIANPLSVYDDPGAAEPDRSDAMQRLVTEFIPREMFKRLYPDAKVVDVPTMIDAGNSQMLWSSMEGIRRAEYWRRVPADKIIALTATGDVVDVSDIPQEQWGMIGVRQVRKSRSYRVEQYIISGVEVLEGPYPWLGSLIPIVPVIGAEVPLDKRMHRSGVVRFARDAQQLSNYAQTAIAETIGQAPKAPYLATAAMIGPYKDMWDTANLKNRPYLLYEPDENVPGGPRREHPAEIPAALIELARLAEDAMKGATGIYDASLGARSNETAGIAIQKRQQEGDTANFHYVDNLIRSLEYAGRILVELIPKVYDAERVVRILGDDDSETYAHVNKTVIGPDGQPQVMNDLASAKFDVRVTVGPSYSTKRQEATDSMLGFIKAVPQAVPLIGDVLAKNFDWPEADEIARRLKTTLPPGIVPPDPQNPPPPPPPPDPMHEAEVRKAQADADRAELQNIADFRQLVMQLHAGGEPAYPGQGPMMPPPGPPPGAQPGMPLPPLPGRMSGVPAG